MGFMVKYCVSCHNDDNAGVATRNYRMLTAVMRRRFEIALRRAKSRRPTGPHAAVARPAPGPDNSRSATAPSPPYEERDRLLRWIDAGTP
jgi:hypothetical protein